MADFFKGLSGGLQAGLQLGQAMRERNQREELAQAFNPAESFLDYTPEGQQKIQSFQDSGGYDVTALPGAEGQAPTLRFTSKLGVKDLQGDSPAAPVDIAPQQVQRYKGTTVAGAMDPMKLQGLQMREAARIIGANGDPVRAAELLASADDLDYKAKMRPLEEQRLKQGLKKGELELTAAERKEKEDSNMLAFENAVSAHQQETGAPPTPDKLKELAATYNLNRSQQFDVVTKMTGLDKLELEQFDLDIKKATKGKDLDGLLKLHKEDKRFGDGTHFIKGVGAKGEIILNLVSDAEPTKVIRTESFTNADLATAYLNKAAQDPANVAEWKLALREKEASIKAKEASANKDNRMGDYYAGGGRESTKDIQKKITSIEKVLDRKLTDEEKSTLVGLTPKSNPNQTMNDKEKLDYAAYMKALAELPETATAAERDALAAKYRVEKFTGEGGKKPNWEKKSADAKSPDASAMRKRNVGYAGGTGTNFYSPESIASRQAAVQQQAAVTNDEEASREAEFQRGLQIYNQNNSQQPTNATLLYPNRVGLTGR